MSNTEVKLLSADCSEGLPLVRLGRRRAVYSGIAQLVVAHDC
jgi:RecB family endonuclease NucS